MSRPAPPATLLLIDVQSAFDDDSWGVRNNPGAEVRIADLLHAWRSRDLPIVHVMHRNSDSGGLFSDGAAGQVIKPKAAQLPGEDVVWKEVNSAFIGTQLEVMLRGRGVTDLIVVGLTTDHCVSTTVRMAANFGFRTTVGADATATFDRYGHDGRHWTAEQMHDSALASLHGEFADVRSTDAIVRSLGANTPGDLAGAPGVGGR